MPAHYCPTCLTLAAPKDGNCGNCAQEAPPEGWPITRPNRYAWLGELLDERYHLVQYVGFGATGEVYRALSHSTGRSFAAKVIDRRSLPRTVDFAELKERLHREVTVLSRIRSPYVVPIIDFLSEDTDLFVIIMDLAMGPTLERLIFDAKQVPIPRALEITEQLLEALGDVHDRGIVHRDLKPDNIVVQTLRSGRPFIRLLDFGVAKQADDPGLTRGFVGTPLYSAPEQIRNAEKVDERADLYSVGCILYTMLTGQPPFRGERSLDVMQQHLTSPIPKLDEFIDDPLMLPALNSFLEVVMAKDPAMRYGSAVEMLSLPIFSMGRAVANGAMGSVTGEFIQMSSILRKPTIAGKDNRPRDTGALFAVGQPKLPQACVALSALGDLAASVSATGSVSCWDLNESRTLGTTQLPGGFQPRFAFVTKDDRSVCVVSVSADVAFIELRTARMQTVHLTEGSGPLWAAASRTLACGALVLTPGRVHKIELNAGVVSMTRDEHVQGIVTHGTKGTEGAHQLFRRTPAKGLLIRESATTVHVEEFDLPQRLHESGSVIDQGASGRLLVRRAGQLFEFDRQGDELRALIPAMDRRWEAAFWTSAEVGVVMRSENGEVFSLRRGGAPERLGEGVTALTVNRERTRAAGIDAGGRLITWEVARSTVVERIGGGKSTEVETQLWDVSATSSLVSLGRRRDQTYVTSVLSNGTRREVVLADVSAVSSVQVSEDSGWYALTTLNGDGWVVKVTGTPRVKLPRGKASIVCASIADQTRTCVYTRSDGALVCVSIDRAGIANERWSRSLEYDTASVRASSVAGRVAVGAVSGDITVYDIHQGASVIAIPSTHGVALDFAFSPDGHMFSVLRPKGIVEVYDAHAGRLAFRTQMQLHHITRVRMEGSGALVVAGQEGDEIVIYAVETGEVRRRVSLSGK